MQKIVGDRLPSFSPQQTALVQGSADYIGINHYTSYYVKHYVNLTHMSYANDWQAKISYDRNGVLIGKQVPKQS